MGNLNLKQIGGYLFSFMLVIASIGLLTNGYNDEWGWFLGLGAISFFVVLAPDIW